MTEGLTVSALCLIILAYLINVYIHFMYHSHMITLWSFGRQYSRSRP